MATGRAIAAAGGIRGLVHGPKGEGQASVVDKAGAHEWIVQVAAVSAVSAGTSTTLWSRCSCQASPCEHAVAVLFALRTRWKARAARVRARHREWAAAWQAAQGAGDVVGVFGLDYWEVPAEDAAWLGGEGIEGGEGGEQNPY